MTDDPATAGVPDPRMPRPTTRADLTNVEFLAAVVDSPLIEVGEFTYRDTEGDPTPFEQTNVRYLYGPQRLRMGAQSVVTKDVAPYETVAGNPVRSRFSPEDVETFLRVR
jgi:Acetyltransferase (isoleucine patch superfamily)